MKTIVAFILLLICFTSGLKATNILCPPIKDPLFVFEQLTVNEGLSQNAVSSILQTKDGYIVIGTYDGLNIFDGFRIKTRHHSTTKTNSLINNRIVSLYENEDGLIWIATEEGISLYDLRNDVFKDLSSLQNSLPSMGVNSVISDALGNVWIGTKAGLVVLEGGDTSKIRILEPFKGENISRITRDKQNNLWISSFNGLHFIPERQNLEKMVSDRMKIKECVGKKLNVVFSDSLNNIWIGGENEMILLKYSVEGNVINYFLSEKRNLLTKKPYVSIFSIAQGKKGDLWLGCKTSGLYHVTLDSLFNFDQITYYDDSESFGAVSHNDIRSVMIDRSNVLWVGTNKGVNYVDLTPPLFYTFKPILSTKTDKYGFKGQAVQSVFIDSRNTMWVGGINGFVHTYDFCGNRMSQIPVNGTIFKILENKDGDIFILSSQELLRIRRTNVLRKNYITEYLHLSKFLDKPNVGWMLFSMCEDNFGNIWVGANGELLKIERNTGEIQKYNTNNNIPKSIISYLYQDPYDNLIWAGTKGTGALKIEYNDKNNTVQVQRITYNQADKIHLICSNYVWAIYRDKNKVLWVGTDAGIGKIELNENNQIVGFALITNDELADLKIVAISEDQSNRLWLNGSQGLYSYNFLNGQVKHYTYNDGLQSNTFTEASYISDNGWLFVGGINGLNFFNTNELNLNQNLSTPIIADFQIFNTSIGVGEEINGHILINRSLNLSPEIELNYKQNNFTIGFSSDHYASVAKKRYRYKLEGYDQDWIETGSNQRTANYSNLPAGTYNFHLKASNNHLLWNDNEKNLTITISPPPWRTWWATTIYILLIFTLLFSIFRYFYLRQIWKRNIHMERMEKEKLQELSKIKERFFTNITHELRTPLLLISEPLNDIITHSKPTDNFSVFRLNIIERNTRRLLTLINQLLDVRRLMNQDLPLSASENNLSENIAEVLKGFELKATNSGIKLDLMLPKKVVRGWYDKDKIEKVIINLISNAFKHTSSGGSINVRMEIMEEGSETKNVKIKIADTGSGISEQDKSYIFDMFYRGDKRDVASSGIGLAFVKVLMEAHKGSIDVESEVGVGSTFTIQFSIDKETYFDAFKADEQEENQISEKSVNTSSAQSNVYTERKKIILIVEDNRDLRDYMKSCLDAKFRVLLAENGEVGFQMACKHQPDLVISDILMPVMDGIAFTKKMKSDKRVAHIPIIINSIKDEEYSIQEAIEAGANDFIRKPANYQTLTMKIENTLHGLDEFAHKVIVEKIAQPPEIVVPSNDELFLKNVNEAIDRNLQKDSFGVNELANELAMSRMQLNRQIKRITGSQPLEFMRNYRLVRAAQLLNTGEMRVAEVMDSVGFSNQSRFNKAFKEKYDVTPNEYINQQKRNK